MNSRLSFLLGFTAVINVLLIVFLAGQISGLREEVADLSDVLATKQDLAAMALDVEFAHEDACTGCHSERRFAGRGGRAEMEAAVAHMQSMPDAGFTDDDVDAIRSSLTMLRCTQCHGDDEIKALALKSEEERRNTIRRMAAMPGSNIDPGEVDAIIDAYNDIIGF